MEKQPGILVIAPPRCGTHMMVDSLTTSLKRHSTRISNYSKSFWDHPTVRREDAIIGVHHGIDDPKFLEYAKTKQVIIMDRNPMGQALSIIAMYKRGIIPDWDTRHKFDVDALVKCKPNSQTFIDYVHSKEFQGFRDVIQNWPQNAEVFSYDKIAREDASEFARLSNYIGAEFIKRPVKDTKDKYTEGIVFLGDPDLWKTIISPNTINKVKHLFDGYDMDTFCNDDKEGNDNYEEIMLQYK